MGHGCAALLISSREDQEYVCIEWDLVQIYILYLYTFSNNYSIFFCFQTMKRIASGSPISLFPVNIPTQNFEMKKRKKKIQSVHSYKKAIQSLARFVFVCRNQSVCCCRRKWNCEFCLSSGGGSTSNGSMSSIRCATSSKDIGMLHFSTLWASDQWLPLWFQLGNQLHIHILVLNYWIYLESSSSRKELFGVVIVSSVVIVLIFPMTWSNVCSC